MLGLICRSLFAQTVLVICLTAVIGVDALMTYVPYKMRANIDDSAETSAETTVNQFKTLRQYYTENVVSKAIYSGSVTPAIEHGSSSTGIPLPATMIHDLSGLISNNGTEVSLYSGYPFPNRSNRSNRQMDSFQREAWDFLVANPNQHFTKEEIVQEVLRVGDIIASISNASQGQAVSIEEINTSINGIDEITQRNASLAQQASVASALMTERADAMTRQVEFFKS